MRTQARRALAPVRGLRMDQLGARQRRLEPLLDRAVRALAALGEGVGGDAREMDVQGVSTRKVKAITEELRGHSFSASVISAISMPREARLRGGQRYFLMVAILQSTLHVSAGALRESLQPNQIECRQMLQDGLTRRPTKLLKDWRALQDSNLRPSA
jgi:hypothetical protein